MDWQNRRSQLLRFEIFSKVGDLHEASVLDVGCGLGDMYECFINQYSEIKYTGIDIVPEFVRKAKEKYPEANFYFAEAGQVRENYDYIFASGTWSAAIPNYEQYYLGLIQNLYRHANKAVVFNMLDERWHNRNPVYATYHPEAVRRYCQDFADLVVLVQGYLQYDFSVFLYKK